MKTATQPYALANPISRITGKEREAFTRDDLIKVIEEKQLERITFHYTALDGKLKELKVPVANRKQAERILTGGERVDGSSLFKGLVDASVSDLYVVPVYKTAFFNPFDDKSLDMMCRFLLGDGSFAPFATDAILHNAYANFKKKTGLEFWALGELEFFLLTEPTGPMYRNLTQRGYHASGPYAKTGDILNEMVQEITRITGCVKYGHSEVGVIESVRSDIDEIAGKQGEQLEVEFLPAPVDDAADYLVLAKWLIRTIAHKHNCVATFTPKLEEGIAGNGFHVHMELRKNGVNIMLDRKGKLSVEAKKLIGGLSIYADSLTAFGNTVSSAYLRLVPHQEAPTNICWSDSNRSAMIRVPLGWREGSNLAAKANVVKVPDLKGEESLQTVELRSPDGSAMTHLLLAGITMAAEWGLTQSDALAIAESTYVRGNIFEDKQLLASLRRLPTSCVESAKILMQNRGLYERNDIFPASIIEYVQKMLIAEKDEGMNKMLSDLPADDRLHRTRKIMHKDLHRH